MTPGWYSNWCAEAFEQLTAKNARLEKDFHLGHWPRYDYDLTTGKLLFSQEGKVAVVAEIQIAGSTSTMAGNWLWAWANSNLPTNSLRTQSRSDPSGNRTASTSWRRLTWSIPTTTSKHSDGNSAGLWYGFATLLERTALPAAKVAVFTWLSRA
ncbi:hypothetical protein LB571_21000 [Mesorhizobium sp. BR1-1-4]|nr:DUF6882 domain-containing protein [Mesorhizobium sp. BR1-1-4]MBZ9926971.1 hypothetical protein [Mesorhizobium sp. BR1-1-4]